MLAPISTVLFFKILAKCRVWSRYFKMLSPDGPLRQRNHFKSFCTHISLYESLHVSMREQQRRNWRHGSAAESGVGSACRPPQRSGRTVRKSAVSVKVSADGPGLLTLAVPGNQKTARGGLGGDFYGAPAHGLGRCRANRNPRVGKRVKLQLIQMQSDEYSEFRVNTVYYTGYRTPT